METVSTKSESEVLKILRFEITGSWTVQEWATFLNAVDSIYVASDYLSVETKFTTMVLASTFPLRVRKIEFASPGVADFLGVAQLINNVHQVLKDVFPLFFSSSRYETRMRERELRMKDLGIAKEEQELSRMRMENVVRALAITEKLQSLDAKTGLMHLENLIAHGKITTISTHDGDATTPHSSK